MRTNAGSIRTIADSAFPLSVFLNILEIPKSTILQVACIHGVGSSPILQFKYIIHQNIFKHYKRIQLQKNIHACQNSSHGSKENRYEIIFSITWNGFRDNNDFRKECCMCVCIKLWLSRKFWLCIFVVEVDNFF